MKRVFILVLLIQLFSCEKSPVCSELIKGKPENHLLDDTKLQTVLALFEKNKLSLENYIIYRIIVSPGGDSHVRCYQYINNLKVLSDEVVFHFNREGHYQSVSGDVISHIEIKPSPSMNHGEVTSLFMKSVEKDSYLYDVERQKEEGCILCELGYYDLNAGISYASQNFTLAWRVSFENSEFPFAILNDSGNSLIYYDNGIRIYY
jgi:Zn-dependent metalloprotease